MRVNGTVKWFNVRKGYGFLCDEEGAEHFVHYSEIQTMGFRKLEEGLDGVGEEVGMDIPDFAQIRRLWQINIPIVQFIRIINFSINNLAAQQPETKTPNGIRSVPIPDWVADELVVRRAWYKKQKLFVPNASPDFTDEEYVYQEEVAYDCTILEEVWESIRPENGAKSG